MKLSTVSRTIRDRETDRIPGVEASIWTERMVTALVNGVEGGKWYSLNKRWPNAYFANAGLFALYPAWRTESHP